MRNPPDKRGSIATWAFAGLGFALVAVVAWFSTEFRWNAVGTSNIGVHEENRLVSGAETGPTAVRSSAPGLPELPETPQAFAVSSSNPFRCIPTQDLDCRVAADMSPFVARSLAEVRWMSRAGYPTAAEREWAAGKSADAVLREAALRQSPGMHALGLLRAAEDADSSSSAIDAAANLQRWARANQRVFGVSAAAAAYAMAAQMDAAANGTAGIQRTTHAAINTAMEATVLGDTMAIRLLPPGYLATSGAGAELAAQAAAGAMDRLRRNDLGLSAPVGQDFRLRDVAPRPIPIRQIEGGREYWVSEQ